MNAVQNESVTEMRRMFGFIVTIVTRKENVLILGSGAREHAFCWKLKKSNNIEKIYVAPGNAGTLKTAENLDLDILNFNDLTIPELNRQISNFQEHFSMRRSY